MLEREHPEDDLVPKCQACSRVALPPRPLEAAAGRNVPHERRYTNREGHNGTAVSFRAGCRCDPCVKAYRNAELRQKKRREAKKEAA